MQSIAFVRKIRFSLNPNENAREQTRTNIQEIHPDIKGIYPYIQEHSRNSSLHTLKKFILTYIEEIYPYIKEIHPYIH